MNVTDEQLIAALRARKIWRNIVNDGCGVSYTEEPDPMCAAAANRLEAALSAAPTPTQEEDLVVEPDAAVYVPGRAKSELRISLEHVKATLPAWEKRGATSLTIQTRGLVDAVEKALAASAALRTERARAGGAT
jgi:hypothetical protein